MEVENATAKIFAVEYVPLEQEALTAGVTARESDGYLNKDYLRLKSVRRSAGAKLTGPHQICHFKCKFATIARLRLGFFNDDKGKIEVL